MSKWTAGTKTVYGFPCFVFLLFSLNLFQPHILIMSRCLRAVLVTGLYSLFSNLFIQIPLFCLLFPPCDPSQCSQAKLSSATNAKLASGTCVLPEKPHVRKENIASTVLVKQVSCSLSKEKISPEDNLVTNSNKTSPTAFLKSLFRNKGRMTHNV